MIIAQYGPPSKTMQISRAELLERFARSRQELARDPYRPRYHFVNPENGSNDPNGLCFWKGKWHLFYQGYPVDENGDRVHWGHAVSDDLVHWKDLPYAIGPGPEMSCWSGATFVEEERVIAIYFGRGSGIYVAVSSDDELQEWRKVGAREVIPSLQDIFELTTDTEQSDHLGGNHVPAEVGNFTYDPCIWKQGEFYYALSGGFEIAGRARQRRRQEFLFRSRDLEHWDYVHPFVEEDAWGQPGDDGACPYFWPIGKNNEKHLLIHFSHRRGSHWLLGDYDTSREKFIATSGGDFTHGVNLRGGLQSPTAFPDGHGNVIAMFNVQYGAALTPGWDKLFSLPQRLFLQPYGRLGVAPAADLSSLRREHVHCDARELPSNQSIKLPVKGNSIELELAIAPQNAQAIEIHVLESNDAEEFTKILFLRNAGFVDWERSEVWKHFGTSLDSLIVLDNSRSSCSEKTLPRAPESAPFFLPEDEPLRLHIFLDRSIVEVFANDSACALARVFPNPDSTGITVRAVGASARLLACDSWQMSSLEM